MEKEFVLPFAGMIKLEKRTSTGAISTNPEDTYISSKDAVVKITRETTVESKPIESGNSYDPVRTRYTKYIQAIGFTLNSYDRQIYRMGTGAAKTSVTSSATAEITETYSVPIAAPYKIVLPYTVSSILHIKDDATGSGLTAVTETTVATGNYKFTSASNDIELNEDMAGKNIVINYKVAATKNEKDTVSTLPTSGVYKVTLYYEVEGLKDGTNKTLVTAEYDSLEFKDGMKHPDNGKETADWSFNMSSVASHGSTKEEITYTDRTDLTAFSAT